jgi:hypothetical protein
MAGSLTLGHGLRESRAGRRVLAVETLADDAHRAAGIGRDVTTAESAVFYRAMTLLRQGKKYEAREVAANAAAAGRPGDVRRRFLPVERKTVRVSVSLPASWFHSLRSLLTVGAPVLVSSAGPGAETNPATSATVRRHPKHAFAALVTRD